MRESETTEEGIRLQGSIDLTVLCITENDETPYVSTREQIPYEYTLNVQGVTGTDQAEVHSELEQLQVNLLEGEELDVKAVLSFSTTVMKNIPLEAIEGVEDNVERIAQGGQQSLPLLLVGQLCCERHALSTSHFILRMCPMTIGTTSSTATMPKIHPMFCSTHSER